MRSRLAWESWPEGPVSVMYDSMTSSNQRTRIQLFFYRGSNMIFMDWEIGMVIRKDKIVLDGSIPR